MAARRPGRGWDEAGDGQPWGAAGTSEAVPGSSAVCVPVPPWRAGVTEAGTHRRRPGGREGSGATGLPGLRVTAAQRAVRAHAVSLRRHRQLLQRPGDPGTEGQPVPAVPVPAGVQARRQGAAGPRPARAQQGPTGTQWASPSREVCPPGRLEVAALARLSDVHRLLGPCLVLGGDGRRVPGRWGPGTAPEASAGSLQSAGPGRARSPLRVAAGPSPASRLPTQKLLPGRSGQPAGEAPTQGRPPARLRRLQTSPAHSSVHPSAVALALAGACAVTVRAPGRGWGSWR